MTAEHFWIITLGAGFGALGSFVFGFVRLRGARMMEDTPTARLRSAAQGYVELEGTAELLAGPPIIAPLTGARCCWWRYHIEEMRQSGRDRNWETVEKDTSDDLFRLADGTGECVVDPNGASVIPGAKDRWYGSSLRPVRGPARGGSGWLGVWLGFAGRYRYTEERILSGRPLYAIGLFRTQGGGDALGSVEADVRELLAKWKRDPKMMAMLDVNHDGRIDEAEWEAARRMARSRAIEASAQEPLPPDVNVLARPADGRPFLLAGIPQSALILRYKLQGLGCLFASFLLGGACILMLQTRGIL